MEEPLLDAAAASELSHKAALLGDDTEDYAPVRSFSEFRCMFWIETVKLWKIAGPAVITILCMYGTNAIISLFAGHIGTIELSAITISLAVISTFSYGFLVNFLPSKLFPILSIIVREYNTFITCNLDH